MQLSVPQKLSQNSFFLSVVLHILLFCFLLSISTVMTFRPKKVQKPPQLYIPSYVYKGAITPPPVIRAQTKPRVTQSDTSENNTTPIQKVQNKTGTLPSGMQAKPESRNKNPLFQKNILAMSQNLIQQNQVDRALKNMNNSEPPILLIGDKQAIVDPLIKLLGRSLSANFHYPRIQGTFGARGRVYVGLVLHPEGYFSDVEIVEGSDIQDFNAAALYAVNTAPRVVGADKFLPAPKRFVVGFIFDY